MDCGNGQLIIMTTTTTKQSRPRTRLTSPALVLSGLLTFAAIAVAAEDSEYLKVTLEELVSTPEKFLNQKIKVTGKVLGCVHSSHAVDANLWVIVLGTRPQPDEKLAEQLIFPTYSPKVRAAEDGFNREVIARCHKLAKEARKTGADVVLYGTFHPAGGLRQYRSGISLALERVRIGQVTIDTDYGDMSEFRAKTPHRLQKAVNGGKTILKAVGKFF